MVALMSIILDGVALATVGELRDQDSFNHYR